MSRKVPLYELRKRSNWSRIHPLTFLFFITFVVLLISIANTSLHAFIAPALIVIVIYLVFFWEFIKELFD